MSFVVVFFIYSFIILLILATKNDNSELNESNKVNEKIFGNLFGDALELEVQKI